MRVDKIFFKMKLNKFIVLIVVQLSLVAYGQTVNTGELYVNTGTQFSVVDAFENTSTASFINDGDTYLYNKFTNSGMVDYLLGGFTRFVGNEQQQVVNNSDSYLYNLVLNNTSGLEQAILLEGSATVERNIDFTEGIINTKINDATLVLQNSGVATNTSDFSFVDGYITKNGDNSFVFPVGDAGYYRFMSISAPDNANASFRAKYEYQDASNPFNFDFKIGNIFLLNTQEYWQIENMGDAEQVVVTLSWDETTTTPTDVVINPEEELIRMARWDFNQGAWVEVLGSTIDVANRTISALETIEGTAVYTLARANGGIILPGGGVIWNAVSPNNDGKNDYLRIDNINALTNNRVEIFNRWGTKLFETSNYDSNGNVFRGYSKNGSKLLPSGTYFYVLTYDYNNNGTTESVEKAGYFYLSTD